MSLPLIPFNKPYMTGRELGYIAEAHTNGQLAGDGPFTKRCHGWLEAQCQTAKALLTHSCTAALEMSALLLDLQEGDEVIMPSFTFVSTANAFVLRRAVPVFVDVDPATLCLDPAQLEAALSPKTRAVVPVHYAGVPCDMDPILEFGRRHKLCIIEDAAQGLLSTYKGKPLGSLGDLGAVSFHETKNIICGEGGALLVNDSARIELAEIIREKGTNRSRFFRGEVDKYTWQEAGSSYLPGELTAAFLWAQFEGAADITAARLKAWNYYHESLKPLGAQGLIRRPVVPAYAQHNAHLYHVLLREGVDRQRVLQGLKDRGIHAVFHYVPLHRSPAGHRFGRVAAPLSITESVSERLIRLPLWVGLKTTDQDRVCGALHDLMKDT